MAVEDTNQSANDKALGNLLSPQERQACQLISTGEAPYSQRAQALLAIDEGVTQAAAAGEAGLTRGQLKYWLAKFRKERMAIFPEASFAQPELEPEPTAPDDAVEAAPEVKAKKDKKPKVDKKKKKKAKAKKGKGAKKSKKGNKGKGAAGKSKKKSKKKKK
jgi:outer membrane biosynthesis protein TonB